MLRSFHLQTLKFHVLLAWCSPFNFGTAHFYGTGEGWWGLRKSLFGIFYAPSLRNVSCIMPPPPLSPSPSSGNTFMGLELQFYLELHQMLVSILFNTSASPSPSPSFIVSKSGSAIYKSRAVHYSQRFRLVLCSFSRFLKFAASFQTMCFLIIH